jgi:uncharacterized protein (TIGR02246 family)
MFFIGGKHQQRRKFKKNIVMRYLLILLIFQLGVINAPCQELQLRDSTLIVSVINDWNKAWKEKDYILAAKGYSQDCRFTNAFGDKRNGRLEVQNLLKEVFALPFVMAGESETTEHLFQVLDNTNVVVHTSVIRKGQKTPDNRVIPDRQTTHMRVFQKKDDTWEIHAHLISDARDKQTPKH